MEVRERVIASFSDLDLIQSGPSTFKLIDRDSGEALKTFVKVDDVSELVGAVRSLLHE